MRCQLWYFDTQRFLNPDPVVYVFSLETFSSKSTPAWKCLLNRAFFLLLLSPFSEFLTESGRGPQNHLYQPSHFTERNWGPGRYRNLSKITSFICLLLSPPTSALGSDLALCQLPEKSYFPLILSTDLRWHAPLPKGTLFIFKVPTDHWAMGGAGKLTCMATMLRDSLT